MRPEYPQVILNILNTKKNVKDLIPNIMLALQTSGATPETLQKIETELTLGNDKEALLSTLRNYITVK